MAQSYWLSLSVVAVGLWNAPVLAQLSPVATLRQQLVTAICLEDWPTALDRTSALIATPAIGAQDRADLVAFRHRLQQPHQRQAILDAVPNCEAHLAQYLEVVPTPTWPLMLERALYSVQGLGEPDLTPDQVARQAMANRRADLVDSEPTPIPFLSPARLIGTAVGSGVSAGRVSDGVEVFAFVGRQGDRLSVDLDVTRILPGQRYADDDSQIYLFDSNGYLIAANDDFDGLQSRLNDVTLPQTGIYLLAVTTYNNAPQLGPSNEILGWTGNGGSAIEYTLTLTGLTPSGQIALPTTAQR